MPVDKGFKPFREPIAFEDTQIAFAYKSDRELLSSYLLFLLMKRPTLVKLSSGLSKWALNAGLPIKPVIRATVFKQFCGGETRAEYLRVIERLGRYGIGAILDYSVEGNVDEADFEATKDALVDIVIQAADNPHIPCACMKMTAIGAPALLEKATSGHPFTSSENRAWRQLRLRLHAVCKAAEKTGKPIYIDAEESWLQGAIDRLSEEMMWRYNVDRAVVFTTLQLYRRDRLDYLEHLIEKAASRGRKLGVKIVRGAYMEKERERARAHGYPSPIHIDKKAADHDYDVAVKRLLDNVKLADTCVGTHNEASCRLTAREMAHKGLANRDPRVIFSQLYGMSDHVSFNLARHGYHVCKYLPFGPIESTLPYLVRRAEENTAIAGQMRNEVDIIAKEIRRRKVLR